jgi:hypothetical protein
MRSDLFFRRKGSGNRNEIGEKHAIVLNDNAVVLTGFYLFTSHCRGQAATTACGASRTTIPRRNSYRNSLKSRSSPNLIGERKLGMVRNT